MRTQKYRRDDTSRVTQPCKDAGLDVPPVVPRRDGWTSVADGFEYELLFDTCSLLLGVVYGVDVDTGRCDPGINHLLDRFRIRGWLATNACRDIVLPAGLDRLSDQSQHGGM